MEKINNIVKKFSLGRVAQDDLQRIAQVLVDAGIKYHIGVLFADDKHFHPFIEKGQTLDVGVLRNGILIIEFRFMPNDNEDFSTLNQKLKSLGNSMALSVAYTATGNLSEKQKAALPPRILWYLPRDFGDL